MGMQFSPMYQPVSTKTIKADGDLNVNPYDLLATDVRCETLTLDYTSVLNSAPNSMSVSRKGYSFTHSSYLTSNTYNVTVPYNKPIYTGLILLGDEDTTFDTMSISVSISQTNSLRYGANIAFYHNGVEVGRVNIAEGGRSGSGTLTLPYQEDIALTYTLVGGEAMNQPLITFADFSYYIVPHGQ